MTTQNLKELLHGVIASGARVGNSANYFDPNGAGFNPPASGSVIIKPHAIIFKKSDAGTVTLHYEVEDNDLGVTSIPKSWLFGKHFTLTEGPATMAQIQCRTSEFDQATMGHVEPVEYEAADGSKPVLRVFDFDVRVKVTFGAKPLVYVPNGRNAWNGHTMDMSKPKENYVTLTLSKA
jgi:hypothetical protein